MRSQKRLKLRLVDGKIQLKSPSNQFRTSNTGAFRIVIRERGRMDVPIKIFSRDG